MGKRNIRFLVMDVDGTLTDGKIYIGSGGELFKAFHVRDGYGIKKILPKIGVIPVIITARESEIVEHRCLEIGIAELNQGVHEKFACLLDVLAKWSAWDGKRYELHNVAYIGDDIPDLLCMEAVKEQGGLTACPADAAEEVRKVADYLCRLTGGGGAVREFIDWLADFSDFATASIP